MPISDVISGALLGAAAAAGARGIWRATAGAPSQHSGRISRAPEWLGSALVLAGCGFYVRAMWEVPPGPAHRSGWWSVAAAGGAVLLAIAAAAGIAWALRSVRLHRPRAPLPTEDGDLAALTARHDAVRERYGALLTLDLAGRLDADPEDLAELTRALTRAADLTTGVESAYTARSAYARSVGELEAAWLAIAAQARRQGISLPDDSAA